MTGPPVPGARHAAASLDRDLMLAFAPLHKAAFGAAVGTAAALVVALATVGSLLRDPDQALPLYLLGQYFTGYTVSWAGVFVGALWAAFVGFVFGWFTAFVRNLMMAIALFVIRTRAELARTRDFLDHV